MRIGLLKSAALGLGIAGAALLAFGRAEGRVRVLARHYPTLFITGIAGGGGALLLLALCLLSGRGDSIALPLTRDPMTILNFHLEMVIGLSFLAPMLQMYALSVLDVALMSAIGLYGTTLVGVVAAIMILHERLTPTMAFAAILLFTSLGASVWRTRAQASVLPAETI